MEREMSPRELWHYVGSPRSVCAHCGETFIDPKEEDRFCSGSCFAAFYLASGVSDEDAEKQFPKGFNRVKPYLRTTPQPNI